MRTVLLTGMPRSGTTLIVSMLNALDDTVALAEPLQLEPHGDRERAVAEIEKFVLETRRSALETGRVITKHLDGRIVDNWVEPPRPGLARRRVLEQRGELKLDKPLSSDFQLILKHPAEFTALADLLKSKFPLFAVVRDPLAVLAAWQTVDMPVGRGRMPMAEAFCPELAARLMEAGDPLARQVILIEWQLRTYLSLPPGRTLRYEDVVAAPDIRLAALAPGRQGPLGAMEPYDPLTRYPAVDFRALATALRPLGELIQRFYPDFERAWAQRLP